MWPSPPRALPAQPPTLVGFDSTSGTFAGFWIRLAAYLIDFVILSVLAVVIFFVVVLASPNLDTATNAILFSYLYLFLASSLYFMGLWTTGGTLGMYALKLRVVDLRTGTRLTAGRSAVRGLAWLFFGAMLGLGLIWIAFDARKQGLHDKVVDSVVVRLDRQT